jgi:hypothetical protein
LVYGPYRALEAGRYRVTVLGELENPGAEAFVDIAYSQGEASLAQIPICREAGPGILSVFSIDVPGEVLDLEIRIKVASDTKLAFRGIELLKRELDADFAIVNKSYAADAKWSLVLFISAARFTRPYAFYLVIPRQDRDLFLHHLHGALLIGLIEQLPLILYEDWVLEVTGNVTRRNGMAGEYSKLLSWLLQIWDWHRAI